MSQVFVRFGSKLAQLGLLIFLSLCVGHPWSATCQSGGPGASDDPAKHQPTAIPDIGKQTTAREGSTGKSENSSFILTEVEPLLLLLFGLLLFSVATVIKLKLSRVSRASGQYFEPLVSGSAGRSETRS
jgi:hypothetical protein